MRLAIFSLFLLAAGLVHGQCNRNSFVLSPSVGKQAGGGLSVNLEAGYLPYLSKSYVSVKSSLWSEASAFHYVNSKGETVEAETQRSAGFVGLNYGFAPAAFENLPRKWLFGAAGGVLLKEGANVAPAAQLSAAYTIRMKSGNYTNGISCFKFEGTCLVSSMGVKPGLSGGVFLVL